MREIAEIELAIQGGTEKIEQLGKLWCRNANRLAIYLFLSGEQGKVEESMREMAAIEALKSEKADEVRVWVGAEGCGVAATSGLLEVLNMAGRG